MVIKKNIVAGVHYTLKDEYGNTVDSNVEYSPLQYLHGYNNIVPSLEQTLKGLSINEEKYSTLYPGGTFGLYDTALVLKLDKKQMGPGVGELQEGALIESEDGRQFKVISSVNNIVTLDGNHPLAGKILDLYVKVVAIREATPAEIQQGCPIILNPGCCGLTGCC